MKEDLRKDLVSGRLTYGEQSRESRGGGGGAGMVQSPELRSCVEH